MNLEEQEKHFRSSQPGDLARNNLNNYQTTQRLPAAREPPFANMEIVINGPRKDNVREEIRAVSSTIDTQKKKREKEASPVRLLKRED